MALGAFTVHNVYSHGSSSLITYEVSIVGDDNVPAGGTANATKAIRDGIEAADGISGSLGNRKIVSMAKLDVIAQLVLFDAANDKLKILGIADGAEDTGDQSANTYRFAITLG